MTRDPVGEALWRRGLSDEVDVSAHGMSSVRQGRFVVVGDVPRGRLAQIASTAAKFDGEVADYVDSAPKEPLLILAPAKADRYSEWTDGDDAADHSGTAFTGSDTEPPWVVLSPLLWSVQFKDVLEGPGGELEATVVHEMVHAYTDPPYWTPKWVIEGYAEMVTADVTEYSWAPDRLPKPKLPEDAEFAGPTQDDSYFLAGDFMVYLSEFYSVADVTAFYSRAMRGNVEDEFEKAFGVKLVKAVTAWQSDYRATYSEGETPAA